MPLTPELLARLDACFERERLPWLARLRPGLAAEQMDELVAPLGIVLPPELRMWWGWHDGTDGDARITPRFPWMSLEQAVGQYSDTRAVAEEIAAQAGEPPLGDPEAIWPSSFLPVTGFSWLVAVDTSRQADASPVHFVDFHAAGSLPLVAPSVGEMVLRWVEMYETGRYRWDHLAGEWERTDPHPRPILTLI